MFYKWGQLVGWASLVLTMLKLWKNIFVHSFIVNSDQVWACRLSIAKIFSFCPRFFFLEALDTNFFVLNVPISDIIRTLSGYDLSRFYFFDSSLNWRYIFKCNFGKKIRCYKYVWYLKFISKNITFLQGMRSPLKSWYSSSFLW